MTLRKKNRELRTKLSLLEKSMTPALRKINVQGRVNEEIREMICPSIKASRSELKNFLKKLFLFKNLKRQWRMKITEILPRKITKLDRLAGRTSELTLKNLGRGRITFYWLRGGRSKLIPIIFKIFLLICS